MKRWQDDGACHDLEVLYDAACDTGDPGPGEPDPPAVAEARAVCLVCKVRTACLDDALLRRDPWGVLGGTTPAERDAMTRGLHLPSVASVGIADLDSEVRAAEAAETGLLDRAALATTGLPVGKDGVALWKRQRETRFPGADTRAISDRIKAS